VLQVAGVLALAALALASLIVALTLSEQKREVERHRQRAEARHAEAQREAARAALARGAPLEARARLRLALEAQDDTVTRALLAQARRDPLLWRREQVVGVQHVAFSPDGETLAGGSILGTLYLFDVRTGEVRKSWKAHDERIPAVAFAPDGRTLATGAGDNLVKLWNPGTGRLLGTLKGHTHRLVAVAFNNDGSRLLSTGHDGTVRIWDPHAAKLLRTLDPHGGAMSDAAFSPDGERLAAGGIDAVVRVWDVGSGKLVRELTGHTGPVRGVSFTPSGERLVSSSVDRTLRLWDLQSGATLRVLRGHDGLVGDVRVGPAGRRVYSCSGDRTVRIWDLATGRTTAVLRGHSTPIWNLALSPNGRLLASSSLPGSVLRLWRTDAGGTPPPEGPRTGTNNARLAFSPDGARLAVTTWNVRTVLLYDTQSGALERMLKGHTGPTVDVAFSRDGRLLASSGYDATVRLWSVETGGQLRVLRGHQAGVSGVQFCADGKLLATSSLDATVRLWSVETGEQVRVLRGHENQVAALTVSPDGETLASAGSDKTIRLWEARTGRLRAVLQGHRAGIFALAFGPRGRRVASGGIDGTVRLWDLAAGTGRVVWREPRARPLAIRFHPAGDRLLVVFLDHKALYGRLAQIDLQRGGWQLLKGEHYGLALAPDGRTAASVNPQPQLWELSSGLPRWRGLFAGRPPRLFTHLGRHPPLSGAQPPRWVQALEHRAVIADRGPRGSGLCLYAADDRLERWDTSTDSLRFSARVPVLQEVRATGEGCAAITAGPRRLWLFDRAGRKTTVIDRDMMCVVVEHDAILASSDKQLLVLDAHGQRRAAHDVSGLNVTAAMHHGGELLVADAFNGIVRLPRGPGGRREPLPLRGLPRAPVAHMAQGPRGTLVASFFSGEVGIWELQSGARIDHVRLNGVPRQLFFEKQRLHVATDQGDHRIWDLGPLYAERCPLLRRVWREVPVVWEGGRAVRRPPPEGHPCSR
jgi:WD40 repeat protein